MFHLHRPVEEGDMLILGCLTHLDQEPTAHMVTGTRSGEHDSMHYLISPPCPCGYPTIHSMAPTVIDVIPKEMI